MMDNPKSVEASVRIVGIDAALEKAKMLAQAIKEAKSLADDLASAMESIEAEVEL